jgi:hypothetical protein
MNRPTNHAQHERQIKREIPDHDRVSRRVLFLSMAGLLFAAPVIAPIGNVTVPAGKSLIVPITATVTNGRPLTYTITGSTNAVAIVLHTNDPFWKLNVVQACAPDAPGPSKPPSAEAWLP